MASNRVSPTRLHAAAGPSSSEEYVKEGRVDGRATPQPEVRLGCPKPE